MDAGDADVEDVAVAGLDGERVLVVASLRVREASTRASGRARADEATTDGDPGLDAGDADVEFVAEAGLDGERVVAASPLRACAKRRRERRAARARTRRRRTGIPDGRGRR